jgi:hypothetical protein
MTLPSQKIPTWIAAIALALSLALTWLPLATTFNVVAQTESFKLVTEDTSRPRWFLKDAIIFQESDGWEPRAFTGSIRLEPGVVAEFERIASGPMRIQFTNREPGSPVARLYGEEEDLVQAVDGKLVLRVEGIDERASRGESIVLPFTGNAFLGDELSLDPGKSPPLVRSGKVTALGHSILGEELFIGNSVDLDLGDRVSFEDAESFAGLIATNEHPGLAVSFRAVSKRSRVDRFGAKGYEVKTSPLARITKDEPLQLAWATTLAILSLAVYLRRSGTKGE